MAYAYKVNRVTISGTSFGGEEEWSTGFFHGYETGDCEEPTEADCTEIGGHWQTFFTTTSTKVNNNWKTTQIKMSTLNTDGSTDLDSVKYYNYPTPISGAFSTNNYPPQISLVGTMKSTLARGLASKGRMYLPGIGATVDTNGRIASTDSLAICTNLRLFLFECGQIAGNNNVPVLASFGRTAPLIGAGVTKAIAAVQVGNVYDTQRRRRNALTETYSTVNI